MTVVLTSRCRSCCGRTPENPLFSVLFPFETQGMRPGLLINAKWRMQSRRTGVQRYAEGLSRALLDTDLKVDFATPERAGRVRAALWEQRTLPRLARRY